MTKTQNHHELDSAFYSEFFDASIKRVPNDIISRKLAHGMYGTCRWLIPYLGIDRGLICIQMHHNQPIRVDYTVSKSYAAIPKDAYDAASARAQLDAAVQMLITSGGVMHPSDCCDCIGAFARVLLRPCSLEFGDVRMSVRDAQLYELLQTAVMRAHSATFEEQLASVMFSPTAFRR